MSEVYGGKMVFPIHNTGHGEPFDEGMSLRDYCAIQAMNGWLASFAGTDGKPNPSRIATFAYEIADAMMEAR